MFQSLTGIIFVACLNSSCHALLAAKRSGGHANETLAGKVITTKAAKAAEADTSSWKVLCSYGPEQGFDHEVKVMLLPDNQRAMVFGQNADGTQTATRCTGSAGPGCAKSIDEDSNEAAAKCSETSCGCQRNDEALLFDYFRLIMDDVLPRCLATPPTETFRVLFVGLGGGALPTYLLEHCKGRSVAVETVEYDPRVIKAATDFFGFKVDNTTNQVECSDGGAAVSRRAGKRIYDSVIVDAFGADDSVPESCSDQSFANATWSMLRPGGKLIQHVWFRQLLGVMNIYKNQFGANHVSDRTVSMFANYLITATYEGSSASTTA